MNKCIFSLSLSRCVWVFFFFNIKLSPVLKNINQSLKKKKKKKGHGDTLRKGEKFSRGKESPLIWEAAYIPQEVGA